MQEGRGLIFFRTAQTVEVSGIVRLQKKEKHGRARAKHKVRNIFKYLYYGLNVLYKFMSSLQS